MSPLKAFIVEDSAVIKENLIAALEELAPLTVVGTAEDEPGALAWLSDPGNRCDLAVLDIFLAQGFGLGVLQAMNHSRTPVERVVLTNYANPDMRQRCLALGASRVFDKSGEIDALIDYCHTLAASQAAVRAAVR